MKKIIVGLFLVVVIAVGAVSYYVFANLDTLVKAAIEKYGSEATKTTVSVDSVKINFKEGSGAIHGIKVGNPAGFGDPNIFSLGEVSTKIDYEGVRKEIAIIDEITVLAPQVFFEMNKDKDINLDVLKKNLMSGQTSAPAAKESSDSGGSSQPVKMIIRHFKFADGDINATVIPLNNKKYKLKLPAIVMKDLGAPNGATPEDISKQIINKLTDQAKAAIKKQSFYKEIEQLKAETRQKVEEKKAELKSKADSKVDAEKERAKDKLKSLFK